eukprot:352475-Chlamydomonas_euryale.AAC.2
MPSAQTPKSPGSNNNPAHANKQRRRCRKKQADARLAACPASGLEPIVARKVPTSPKQTCKTPPPRTHKHRHEGPRGREMAVAQSVALMADAVAAARCGIGIGRKGGAALYRTWYRAPVPGVQCHVRCR